MDSNDQIYSQTASWHFHKSISKSTAENVAKRFKWI